MKKHEQKITYPLSIHDFGPFLKQQGLLYAGAEIGVAEGRSSTEFMGWGFKKLYLVDMWATIHGQAGDASNPQSWHDKNYEEVKERMTGKNAILLKGDSVAMADQVSDNSLGSVYIDANHSYEGAMRDLIAWTPKLKAGGIMAGHDYNSLYGVKKAVDEFTGGKAIKLPEQAEENAGFYFYVDAIR